MNSQKVSQTFNGRTEWLIESAYFKLLATVNSVDVELWRAGRVVLKAVAVDGGYYQRVDFDKIVITTTALETVSFLAAADQGGSDRFTGDFNVTDRAARLLGIVYGSLGQLLQQVIGGVNALAVKVLGGTFADAITDDGKAFAATLSVGPTAANFSTVQVKNPAASGKTVYVDAVAVSGGGVAEQFKILLYDVDLTTDGGALVNKDSNAAAATSHIRSQAVGGGLGTAIADITNPAFETRIYPLVPPVKLGAGEGLIVQNQTVNVVQRTSFQVREY